MGDDYDQNHTTSNSDDSDNELKLSSAPELRGYLSKWTNYIHGWQARYIVLKDGTLSYYKSEQDSDFGCRGAISLQRATIKSHEFDECRFDVSISNCVWYLRTETPEDKMHWIEVLESYKTDITGSSTESTLRRHGSSVSLQSNSLSTASGCSTKKASRSLREKLHEIETFKDILFDQVQTLQRYFDSCAEVNANDNTPLVLPDGLSPIDFKGEAFTFRATTVGVIATLQHCMDIMVQHDQQWRRRLDKETDKRQKFEDLARHYEMQLETMRARTFRGPDMEEGPNSILPEDEFFDAVESGLDKIEEDRQLRVRLKLQSQQSNDPNAVLLHDTHATNQKHEAILDAQKLEEFGAAAGAVRVHRLWPEIDRVCKEQLHHARQGVGEYGNGWQLFAEDGEMKMYRREEEVNGMVIDPLKACHVVQGVTAREMCHYFFSPEFRNDWETTLEDMKILEKIAPDTLVFLQTHKRIWPASQRDALFWSHIQKIDDNDAGVHDSWAVFNHSTEHDTYPPPNTGKCLRIYLTVSLECQTIVAALDDRNCTRNELTCKITYCSVVNPGGWAPPAVLRAIYKKEYPKFLKRFTQYVVDQCKDKPIMF